MSNRDFEALLERYSEGWPLCNCSRAYATPELAKTVGGDTVVSLRCDYGCSSNQISAVNYLAQRARSEIEGKE
jgi:hypothetical protein